MGFTDAIKAGFQNYVNFDGRATRSEYWFWILFVILASIVLTILDGLLFFGATNGVGVLGPIFSLATLIPGLSITIRRLHDLDKSGWWFLLSFIPLIGALVLLYWFCLKGTDGDNRFGAQRH